MTIELAALRTAIDLVQVPSRIRQARAEALPPGMLVLLQVAVGEETAMATAAELTGRPAGFLREAATFFIEQILLAPNCDSFRVLAADATAPATDLRRNMALLLRWLHPDVAAGSERSAFAGRVTAAWDDLKTPERRAAYESALQAAAPASAKERATGPRGRRRRVRPPIGKSAEGRGLPGQGVRGGIWRFFGRWS